MKFEILVGNEVIREVKGSFESAEEANRCLWELLAEYPPEEIWIEHCMTGELVRADKLFKGFIKKGGE